MTTRRELIAEIDELGRALGEEPHATDRMNHAALTELAASMRARLDERNRPAVTGDERVEPEPGATVAKPFEPAPAPEPQAYAPPPPAPAVYDPPPTRQAVDGAADEAEGGPPLLRMEEPKPPRAPYCVAPGRSIVARGRVLGPNKPVRARDFPQGQKDLDDLVLRGAVIRT